MHSFNQPTNQSIDDLTESIHVNVSHFVHFSISGTSVIGPAMHALSKRQIFSPEMSSQLATYLASRQVEKILATRVCKQLQVQFRGSTVPVWINEPDVLALMNGISQQDPGSVIPLISGSDSAPANGGLSCFLFPVSLQWFLLTIDFGLVDWLIDWLIDWLLNFNYSFWFSASAPASHTPEPPRTSRESVLGRKSAVVTRKKASVSLSVSRNESTSSLPSKRKKSIFFSTSFFQRSFLEFSFSRLCMINH